MKNIDKISSLEELKKERQALVNARLKLLGGAEETTKGRSSKSLRFGESGSAFTEECSILNEKIHKVERKIQKIEHAHKKLKV